MAANPQMLIRIAANLSELKRNLAEGKSSIEATTAGMQKMAASLDGSKLEQRAHNITAAINSVGGATKLTDAEAQRHLTTLDAWIAKAGRMGKEVPSDILKTRDALVRTNAELVKTETLSQRAGGFLKSTFAQFTLAGLATQAISKLTSELSAFVATGLKLPAVEQSYSRLTKAMGVDGQTMLANMTTSTRGMVANYDLMTGANKAMLLGLPVTAASMGDLAKTATILGKAMGQDATKSLDDLITALGRSSPMILDNLGLSVKVGEANEVMAAKLGKTAEQLTEGEKKMAFYQAAMEAARKKTAELGEQTRTLGDIVTSVWTQIGNVVSAMSGKINVGIGSILSSQKNLIQYFKDVAIYGNVWDAVNAASIRAAHTVGRDVVLAVEKAAVAVKGGTKGLKDHVKAIEEVIAKTPEQLQVEALLSKAKAHEKSQVDFAASAWKAWEQAASTALKNVEKNSAPLKLIARDLSGLVPQVAGGGAGNMAGYTAPVAAGPGLFATMFGSPQQFGQQMASTIMGAIQGGGNVVGAAAGMVGSTVGSNIAGMLKKDGTKMFTGALGGIFSAALPVVGSLLGPLTEAIWGKLFGTKGRDSVKDFVAGFGGFDAFHAMLGEKLPADAERLWIALTQGVGRNNPEQAKAIIDQITAALAAQKDKTDEVAAAAAASSAMQTAALDAISAKYSDSISKLESEYKSLSDSVAKEAEEAVMGLTEANERERMKQIEAEKAAQMLMRDTELAAKQEMFDGMLTAGQQVDAELRAIFGKPLEIPYHFTPQNAPNYGSGGGGGGTSSGGGSSRSDGSQTIVVQVDGEVLTRAVVNTAKRHGAT